MTTNVQINSNIQTSSVRMTSKSCPKHSHSNQFRRQASFDPTEYQNKLSAFVGIWEDHPRHQYQTEFRLENGQLVGYSSVDEGKALASLDGNIINMVIVHSKQPERSVDRYRGRMSWNQQYINWEKEDSSREGGWRPTRKWVKIQ